jgi:hypothetical protein
MNSTEPRTQDFAGQEQHASAPPVPSAFAGRPAVEPRDARIKSPSLAAAFSVVPGLGQVYVGYYPRGFVHIIVVAGIISILASSSDSRAYTPLLALFLGFFWLYNMIDAARLAALYNRALFGGHEPDLPHGFELPGMGGSILGGSVLVAAAFVVLLHTRFDVRLDWLGDWWPVFPMLFGVWLIAKAISERRSRP